MHVTDLLEHVDVNVGGPVRLFQACLPLLKSAEQPKFGLVSSMAGGINGAAAFPFPRASHGASKAAANFVLRRIRAENPDIISLAIHPGYVTVPATSHMVKRATDVLLAP